MKTHRSFTSSFTFFVSHFFSQAEGGAFDCRHAPSDLSVAWSCTNRQHVSPWTPMQSLTRICSGFVAFFGCWPANEKSIDKPCPGSVAARVSPSPQFLLFMLAAKHAGQLSNAESLPSRVSGAPSLNMWAQQSCSSLQCASR